jgi:hypothetical protein
MDEITLQVKAGVKLRKSGEMMRLTQSYIYDKYHHTHNIHHTPRFYTHHFSGGPGLQKEEGR